MNSVLKYGTMITAIIGAVTGVWAKYVDYSESEFKRPITQREAMAASFTTQIASAESRGDAQEATRLRIAHEKYEESWRAQQDLLTLTDDVLQLRAVRLGEEQTELVRTILQNPAIHTTTGNIQPETLGSAYLAIGDYDNASRYYSAALATSHADPNILALRGLALKGRAQNEQDPILKNRLVSSADELFSKAEMRGVRGSTIDHLEQELEVH